MSDATRFPLCWPAGRPRTQRRESSRFKVRSLAAVRDELFRELDRMGAKETILSTNLRVRNDGLPAAGQAQPADPGVAVYFRHKGKAVCFACDRWSKIEDNLQAVHHTIEALRGIARWGTGDMVNAAFTGFAALEAPKRWWETLGVKAHESTEAVESAYRRLILEHHPDRGGNSKRAAELNTAIDVFRQERGIV